MSDSGDGPPARPALPAGGPSLALGRCRRGPDGRPDFHDLSGHFDRVLGCPFIDYLKSIAGRRVAEALESLFRRLDGGSGGDEIDMWGVDGRGEGRRLHWRLIATHNLFGGEVVVAVIDTLPGTGDTGADAPTEAALWSAVLRGDLDADGGVRFNFVDAGVARLTSLTPAAFARTSAGRMLAQRVRLLYEMTHWSAESPLNLLELPPLVINGPYLLCRLFRGLDSRGQPFVGMVLHDPTPQLEHERAQRRRQSELLQLLRLSDIVIMRPPRDDGLARIVDEVASTPEVKAMAIGIVAGNGARLSVTAHTGIAGRPSHEPFDMPLDAGLQRALVSRDLVVEALAGPAGTRIYQPIEAGGMALGVIEIAFSPPRPVDPWYREILGGIADYAAVLLTDGIPTRTREGRLGEDALDVAALLTLRQRDVLFQLAAFGSSNEDIAAALAMAPATVKVHMREILKRLEVDSRAAAIHRVLNEAPNWLDGARRRNARRT
ncbi:MAG: LuxR C-terminal-related transcriptional regulator [Geminicoccaceae bacterium]